MRWPQFELWRIFAAVGLSGASIACFSVMLSTKIADVGGITFLAGLVLLGASAGTPFKKGLAAALCLPVAVLSIALMGALCGW